MKNPPLNRVANTYNVDTLSEFEIQQHAGFLMRMLEHVARGGTLASYYKTVDQMDRDYVSDTRLRLTLSLEGDGGGVDALQKAYHRARVGFIEAKFDELFDVFDSDEIKADPRLASAAKGKSDNIRWALSKLKPQQYGDKLQVEHVVDVDVVDRLQAGRERAAALSNDSDS